MRKLLWFIIIVIVIIGGFAAYAYTSQPRYQYCCDEGYQPLTSFPPIDDQSKVAVPDANPELTEDLKFLPGWTSQQSAHFGVGGNADWTGFILIPPKPHNDVISIGEFQVSICSDVPDATKCFGGGKESTSTVTFTRSSDPFVLSALDVLQKGIGVK